MTFLQFAGDRPICPVSRCSLAIALFPSFSLISRWSVGRSCESCQIPNHRAASLLNGTVLAPTFTVATGAVFLRRKIAASVFPLSNSTPLFVAQSMDAAAASDSLAATVSSSALSTHHPISSTKIAHGCAVPLLLPRQRS